MNAEEWEKYEQERNALRRRFRKYRRLTRLVWLGYNVLADTLLFWLVPSKPLALGIVAFSTLLSTIMLTQRNKNWLRIEAEQERLLMDNAPVGKIRLYDD